MSVAVAVKIVIAAPLAGGVSLGKAACARSAILFHVVVDRADVARRTAPFVEAGARAARGGHTRDVGRTIVTVVLDGARNSARRVVVCSVCASVAVTRLVIHCWTNVAVGPRPLVAAFAAAPGGNSARHCLGTPEAILYVGAGARAGWARKAVGASVTLVGDVKIARARLAIDTSPRIFADALAAVRDVLHINAVSTAVMLDRALHHTIRVTGESSDAGTAVAGRIVAPRALVALCPRPRICADTLAA